MPRAIALFSGGLDSRLAVRVMQEQGFEVLALNVRTIFSCCRATAARAADELQIPLTVMDVDDDYVDVVRNPAYGYGKGVNPCIDCRIYMCRMAGRWMRQCGAEAVITGEVAGQRPMSQNKHQLEIIQRRSGLDDRLVRPLSARLLPPTLPEREGLLDRSRLYAFHGRKRRPLMVLAEQLGLRVGAAGEQESPSTGCALTERTFAPRVRDLLGFAPDARRWDFELLNHGRHFRSDARTKLVVGRNEVDNAMLRGMAGRADASESLLLMPQGFAGPDVLIVGPATAAARAAAGDLMRRYAGGCDGRPLWACAADRHGREAVLLESAPNFLTAEML